MSEEAALPRLELPKQPYRSRFYRDKAFGRLTGKPMNIISQKNANTSTIVNNFLAGLDNINNTESQLDSTSHFEFQFLKGENPINEFPEDLQCKKKWSAAGTELQLPENSQSHHAPESYTDKIGENNGSCCSKEQTAHWLEPVAIADDKANVGDGGVGDGVCIAEAVEDGRDFHEPEGALLIDVEALLLEADVSPVEKFGMNYNAEASVVNSTPNPSKLSQNSKPKMRLRFNTSVTPIAAKSPAIRAELKNIVSNTLGVEEPTTLSSCFGKKPTVSILTQPPQVAPSVFAPKCNDFEFELMEEESFCFDSWTTIPRKVLNQKPDEQENKSVLDIKMVKKKEKHQKAGGNQVAATDEKRKELLNEPCKQLEDTKSCKQNKQLRPEESAKNSVLCPMKNNVEEELQNEPSTISKLPLTSMQKTKLGYRKRGKSGEKCVKMGCNRGDCEAFQEELALCTVEKADRMDDCKVPEQGAVNCKKSAETGSSTNLAKAVESNRKMAIKRLCSGIETPNKHSGDKDPISSDHYTKCMDLVSMPLVVTTADNNENDKLAELETYQPRTSLFSGKNKETTIVNESPALSRVSQKIKSKRPSLNTCETPAVLKDACLSNQQKGHPSEDVVPSSSGLEKHQKEAHLITQASSFGIKPAISAAPHPKRVIPVTSAPHLEFEFELEEENFCFESWITIPKKPFVQKLDPAEQEKKSVVDAKTTIKKERTQKKTKARAFTIQSKKINDKKQFTQNKKSKTKYENQPKKRSACPLKNNTEKEQEEAHNESSSHSKCLLPPRQKKLKAARPRKKSMVESDGNEKLQEQEELHQECHFHVMEYKNSTEMAELFDKHVIASKELLESEKTTNLSSSCSKHLLASKQIKLGGKKQGRRRKELVAESNKGQKEIKASFHDQQSENRTEESRISEQNIIIPKNLPECGSSINDCNEKESKLPSFAKLGTQNKRRAKKHQKQKPIVKTKMSKKETQLKKHGSANKSLPSFHEPDENLVQDNTYNVCSRSRRLTRRPPKWWIVQHAEDYLQNEMKTNDLPEQKDNLQKRMAKGKSAKSQMRKKMVLKRASSDLSEQLEIEEHSSEEQIFEKDFFENVCYPGSPSQDILEYVSVKEEGRKQKYTLTSPKPKKRLFSEAEEVRAKPSDVHQQKKQKSLLKQKVHNVSVRGKNEMKQKDSDQLVSSAHVSPISRQTKHHISSSKPTSQKPFQESSASFNTTYVIKSPQKVARGHPEPVKVSSETPNQGVMSSRKSITRPADQPCTSVQVPSAISYHAAMSTRKYQDKTVPSQPCGQTPDENEESDEPESNTSVKGMRTLKQRYLCRDLPVFNRSGPGPTVNYQRSSDAGDNGNLEHEDFDDASEDDSDTKQSIAEENSQFTTDFNDASEDDSDTKQSIAEENSQFNTVYYNEKKPSEVEESLKSTCVWSEKDSNEIFVDCVKTSEMCNFVYPLRTEYNDNRSIAICKTLNWKTFSCGKLVLGPYKEKGCQMVYKDTMIFHILKGDLGITIYRTTYHLKEGDYFFVPSGNTYNVTNLQDTEAVLLFTQLKGAKME